MHFIKATLTLFIILFSQSLGWAGNVVVLLSRTLPPYEQAWDGLSQAGGLNLQKTNMEGNADKGKEIIQGLKPENTDLLVTIGSEATLIAQQNIGTIPVVYTMVLEEPNFAGKASAGVLMKVKIGSQLEVMSKLIPNSKGIGVLYHPQYTSTVINEARQQVKAFNTTLVPIAVENISDITPALGKMTSENIGMLWMVVDPLMAKPQAVQLLIAHALKEKLPLFALSSFHVKAGAFAAISVDYKDIGVQTADLAKKILANPHHRAAEYPRHLFIYVNSDTMNKIGIHQLPEIPGVKVIKQ